jgi:flagellar motor switch protein FliN/FliY
MSQNVELEQLQATTGEDGGARERGGTRQHTISDLRRLSAVPVDLSVEIGRTRMTVGETLELHEGSVITLDRLAGEPVDLLVNGTLIGRGEVVVIDEQFGIRLTEVLTDTPAETVAGEGTSPAAPSLPQTVSAG